MRQDIDAALKAAQQFCFTTVGAELGRRLRSTLVCVRVEEDCMAQWASKSAARGIARWLHFLLALGATLRGQNALSAHAQEHIAGFEKVLEKFCRRVCPAVLVRVVHECQRLERSVDLLAARARIQTEDFGGERGLHRGHGRTLASRAYEGVEWAHEDGRPQIDSWAISSPKAFQPPWYPPPFPITGM